MKVAGIFPIGTTVGGCPEAIAEILRRDGGLDAYALCGEQAAPDKPKPMDFYKKAKALVSDERVRWMHPDEVEPFDFSQTYTKVREAVLEIGRRGYDRVYVGLTGGANPIVVSLFQTAMAHLTCEVIPIYVQASGDQTVALFKASDVRDRIVAQEATAAARGGQIHLAASLAGRLPRESHWGFLAGSLKALAQWDDFDYGPASRGLAVQTGNLAAAATNEVLSETASTVTRISANANGIVHFTAKLLDLNGFPAAAAAADWEQEVDRVGKLLVADAIANAGRRITEGRYTDAVLRSYRAIECAMQMKFLALRIHPSAPEADKAAYDRYCHGLSRADRLPPKMIMFKAGLKSLSLAGKISFQVIELSFNTVASCRNQCYLEHGYERVPGVQAAECLAKSIEVCRYLAGSDIERVTQEFEMRF